MNPMLVARPFEILLVEDSVADIELTEEGLKEGKVWHRLSVARDRVEAMEFLQRQGNQ
jgi:CheY-like chemotaxis protein